MKFRSRKMHFYYTFGLFMIYFLSRSYSMPSPDTDDDENEWRKWSDGDDDYYDDDFSNETLNTTKNINTLANNNNSYNISNINDSSTETSTTASIVQDIPIFTNLLSLAEEPKSIDEDKCPENCICANEYHFINCSNNNLKQIPNDIPTQAIRIDLSHNLIETLNDNDLHKLIFIKDINLEDNKINNIHPETFTGLRFLDTINLGYNKLNEINPNTFTNINYLTSLDLSNNPLKLPKNGSLLNQPNLKQLIIKNIGLTEIYEETFKNLSGLTSLNMDENNFHKKINIKAFEPMKSLAELKLPELERNTITDLCQTLTSIDNIALKYFDVSCYELVAGASFNDSIILRNGLTNFTGYSDFFEEDEKNPIIKNTTVNFKSNKVKMNTTNLNETAFIDDSINEINKVIDNESSYMVAISSQTINYILFGIMIIAVLGLMIGIICRKDYFGIKTKMCRTKKTRRPPSTDQVRPAEEIPLNKV